MLRKNSSRPSHSASRYRSSRRPSSRRARSAYSTQQSAGRRRVSSSSRRPVSSGGPSRRRHQYSSIKNRTAEIGHVGINTRSIDPRTSARHVGGSLTERVVKRHRRFNIVLFVVVAAILVVLAFSIGSCAFRAFTSGNMALNDDAIKAELATPQENEPYNILITGLSNSDTSQVAASFIGALHVDSANKSFSLMLIPNNIAVNYGEGPSDATMLRDAPQVGGEVKLLQTVKDKTGLDFAHYLRITEEGFVSLVDKLGGIDVNVTHRVDDPTVGHVVIGVGEQTLSGEQALAFVSATNYTSGRTMRDSNQLEALFALINKMTSASGFDWASSLDSASNAIKTDLTIDDLTALAELYTQDTQFNTASMPGSQYYSNNENYFSINAKQWNEQRQLFSEGQDVSSDVDTSAVDKSKLSIIVLNGTGTAGFAAQAASILEQNGYSIQETGNADSFVYDETLVIYREEDDKAAAEAIVSDLGIGRAVYASVYYNLKTDIQVVVGKDWRPVG